MNRSSNVVPVLLIILFCILTRIPQFISPDLRLDSDECVVGIMAKHLMQGKDFPMFFYGQYYGFSLIEELVIIPFYLILGINAYAVKLGMLVLWILGVVYFYKALVCLNGNRWFSFFISLIFIATPAWALWSLKARGGYLTSHLLTSVVLYLIFDRTKSSKNISYLIIGLLLLVIFQSQPFWLVGIVPLLMYRLVSERNFAKAGLVLIPIIILWYPLNLYKEKLHIFYRAPWIEPKKDILISNINRFPDFLYNSLHGTYHFSWLSQPNFFSVVFAYLFMGVILFIGLSSVVYLFLRKDKAGWLFLCSTLFLPMVLAYSLLSPETSYRYMLPVTVFTLFAVSVFPGCGKIDFKVFRKYIIAICIIGTIGIASFYQSQLLRSDREALKEAIQFLKKEQVAYVYVDDYTFHWDITFLTNEKMTTRFFSSPARYPEYDSLVDLALKTGKKTAVFGNIDRRFNDSFGHYELENSQYYISLNPTKEVLQRNGFQFYNWQFR